MSFVGQGANTIPVTYLANEPVFSLSQNGPWVKSLTVAPNTASWFTEPADPAGLTITDTPHYRSGNPYANGTEYSGVPSGLGMSMLVPAASAPAPKPTQPKPTPKPVVKAKVAVALTVHAPAKAQSDQTIPVSVRLMQNGKPFAHQLVHISTSAGTLSRPTVETNGQGIATDTITHAPTGKIHVAAKRGALTAGAVVTVASPFPWWLILVLVLAVALLVLVIIRRRHQWTAAT